MGKCSRSLPALGIGKLTFNGIKLTNGALVLYENAQEKVGICWAKEKKAKISNN